MIGIAIRPGKAIRSAANQIPSITNRLNAKGISNGAESRSEFLLRDNLHQDIQYGGAGHEAKIAEQREISKVKTLFINNLLQEIYLDHIPHLTVFNKVNLVNPRWAKPTAGHFKEWSVQRSILIRSEIS